MGRSFEVPVLELSVTRARNSNLSYLETFVVMLLVPCVEHVTPMLSNVMSRFTDRHQTMQVRLGALKLYGSIY